MNTQERTMLQDFLGKLTSVRGISKDAEADALIKQAVVAQPDANYLLVQNILLMQHALTELNGKVQALEQQLQNAPAAQPQSSFLGAESQNAVRSYFSKPSTQQAQSAQPSYQQGGQGYQQPQQQQSSSGMGDFLRSAGTTAAGVAGGMLLFEGVSHLFGGGSSFGHSGMGGMSGAGNTENVTNNYYNSPAPQAPAGTADDGFLSQDDVGGAFDSSSDSSFDSGGFGDSDPF
jgi:uncharacterized protein